MSGPSRDPIRLAFRPMVWVEGRRDIRRSTKSKRLRLSGVEVRPVYSALIVIAVVLVVVHIVVDLALLHILVLNVAVESVIVLAVG